MYCSRLRLSCSLGSETHCREHIRDHHPVAIIGIDEARSYECVAANNEGRRYREHPRIVSLKGRKIQIAFHHFLDVGADPDSQIKGKGIPVVHVREDGNGIFDRDLRSAMNL